MSFSVIKAAREAPEAPALIAGDVTITFFELASAVEAKVSDLRRWDRRVPFPLVCSPTVPTLTTLYACFEAHVPVALLHPRLPPLEVEALKRRVATFRLGEDALVVAFTSGTSGVPKAVELSRGAMVAAAVASAERLGWQKNDRWLLSLSYAHVGGLSILTRCLLARRAVVVAEDELRFSPVHFIQALSLGQVTLCSLVPAQLAQVLDREVGPPPRLRAVLLGGAAASPEILSRAADLHWPVLTTYGLTESCSQLATQHPGTTNRRELGCGLPLSGVEVRIADGRIQVRSRALLTAYHPPDMFPSPLTPDGWLDTGDLGRLGDDGRLHVLGRSDELIVTGGEKVSPQRVEEALLRCPGIAQAAAFGVPDATWGELVAVALVSAGEPPAPDELKSAIAQRLASFERPRLIAFVSELPRGSSGKVLRGKLGAACEGRLSPVHYGYG
jgi:O-succinylbenzoic acid--CoA ligase